MEMGILSILGAGFLIGMKHALDADHVVAVTTIISETKSFSKATLVGMRWGLGHTSTLFLVGLLVILTGIRIPENFTLSLELLVGVVLVWLGISTIRGYYVKKVHVHHHDHEASTHMHFHYHQPKPKQESITANAHKHEHKAKASRSPFIIGMIHGLAGSGALMLLILGTISSTMQGLLYIVVFGVGSTIGMLIISTIISLPFVYTSKKSTNVNRIMSLSAGSASVIAGVLIMFSIVSEMLH